MKLLNINEYNVLSDVSFMIGIYSIFSMMFEIMEDKKRSPATCTLFIRGVAILIISIILILTSLITKKTNNLPEFDSSRIDSSRIDSSRIDSGGSKVLVNKSEIHRSIAAMSITISLLLLSFVFALSPVLSKMACLTIGSVSFTLLIPLIWFMIKKEI